MIYSKIIKTSSYLPVNIVHNKELEKILETTDNWIRERSGIVQRHIVAPAENSTTMAVSAAEKIFASGEISKDEVDMIIMATCTPAKLLPSSACFVQAALGIKNKPAFDINSACSGFIYALSTADQYIRNGSCKKILVIGSDAMSQIVDWEDRSTCILFGDGAGAVLLGASDEPGILANNLGADGSCADLLKSKGSLLTAAEPPFISMQGKEVFKKAVKTLGAIVEDILHDADVTADRLSWLIPHQANQRIIESTAKLLDMPMEKVILTIDKHANTSAASIPLALDEGVSSGKIKRGDILLLEAFGAGLSWGASLIKY
ncbi:MAG: ketoacyl-ACP synthase III [Legionellales bacterium]|nr:ketoacyl-ACP synthase III [Legionellales bacterium]